MGKAISKKIREQIRLKYGGKCAYCGCELGKIWHADHIKSINRYAELVRDDNGKVIRDKNGNAKRITKIDQRSTPYKFAKKYGLIEETGKPVLFYFERLLMDKPC